MESAKVAQTMESKRETAAAAPQQKGKPIHYPFWFGGSACCMATTLTHPLDLVKVRLQMRSGDMPKTMTRTFAHIVKNDGLLAIYSGLSASLLRQMTYSTVRFAIYEELKNRASTDNKQPGLPTLVAIATVSGLIGGFSGNAADVVNVRMQHDAALPHAERRNYKNGLDGMYKMARHEGIGSWFRGIWPNSVRAAFMTSSQLASYDVVKGLLLSHTSMGDTLATHFTASFMAAVVAATVTNPVDVVKTRVMSGSAADHGVVSVLKNLIKTEGFRWMFRGWTPSFLRLGPQTIGIFIFLEMHRKMYRKFKNLED